MLKSFVHNKCSFTLLSSAPISVIRSWAFKEAAAGVFVEQVSGYVPTTFPMSPADPWACTVFPSHLTVLNTNNPGQLFPQM